MFLGLQTFYLELPENRQRQPAMLTVRHTYMYIITGCQNLAGSQESNVYGVAQTRTRLLGRQMFRTPVCKRTRHLDFPPKLCSNSIFKPPQPARVARASACSGLRSLILNWSSSTSLALALVLALCTWKYDHEFLTATVEKAPPAVESDVLPPGGAG